MRKLRGIRGGLALVGTLSAATVALAEDPAAEAPPVQVVTAVVGGKNVYIPSTIALAAQQATSLSLFNTTDKPHGFAIPALGIEVVVPEQIEERIELPALPAGLYRIHCQLHEAHRSATLLVVDD